VWWIANRPEPAEPAYGSLASISTGQWRRLNSLFDDDADPATWLRGVGDGACCRCVRQRP
jgi:hypothetical protein